MLVRRFAAGWPVDQAAVHRRTPDISPLACPTSGGSEPTQRGKFINTTSTPPCGTVSFGEAPCGLEPRLQLGFAVRER